MYIELIKAVLTPIVAFLLSLVLKAIGVELDPQLFATIVAAIVVYFLTLFGFEAAMRVRAIRNFANR